MERRILNNLNLDVFLHLLIYCEATSNNEMYLYAIESTCFSEKWQTGFLNGVVTLGKAKENCIEISVQRYNISYLILAI